MSYQNLYDIEGLQFVPVNEHKAPIIKNWQTGNDKRNLKNCYGVGVVCGEPSGNLECIDIDTKYDLTGKLFENYKKIIHRIDKNILGKLVVQKTRSGGYHLIYRCSQNSGNIKLANRPTTEKEKSETYESCLKKKLLEGIEQQKAEVIAQKERDNDKVRVLIETRGIGGQFVISPTPGYEFVFGDLISISEITPDEREILFNSAFQFNEIVEEIILPKQRSGVKIEGISAFDDYNQRGDVVDLLQQHGWKVVKTKGNKVHFLRPGQSTAQTSGNFDTDKNWFSVFTTSSEFDPMKSYLPYAVFAKLECNNDFTEASKKLYDMGYGARPEPTPEPKQKAQSTRVINSRVDPQSTDESYFATPEDYDGYLQSVRDGTLQMGLTTGSPVLDKYFLFKPGNLVMTNGVDNVGKSEFVWWLELIAAMYHGWKGVIFSSENTLGAFMRRMIQLYWGKPLRGEYAMSDKEYFIAKQFIEKHFKLIKAQEDLYNYKDIINLTKMALSSGKYDYGMIDPYNSLKVDLSGFSKLSTHEYHYEALSEIKSFGQKNNFGWFINNHAVTAALRTKDSEKKYPAPPRKEDTEGGGKFSNKADDFMTIHRITQHPTEWMVTEAHIRKIKDTETGGHPTPMDEPVKFERYRGGHGYREWFGEGFINGVDPIQEWHWKREGRPSQQVEQPKMFAGWLPYKDDNKTEIDF